MKRPLNFLKFPQSSIQKMSCSRQLKLNMKTFTGDNFPPPFLFCSNVEYIKWLNQKTRQSKSTIALYFIHTTLASLQATVTNSEDKIANRNTYLHSFLMSAHPHLNMGQMSKQTWGSQLSTLCHAGSRRPHGPCGREQGQYKDALTVTLHQTSTQLPKFLAKTELSSIH